METLIIHLVLIGLEVKVRGTKHDKKHVDTQYNWGRKIEANGGEYYIITSVEEFWDVMNGDVDEVYTLSKIELLLKLSGSKVVF